MPGEAGEFELEQYFPGLLEAPWRVTSPASAKYNCIAWAAGDSTRWWWPSPTEVGYWPNQVPRQETVQSFFVLFQLLGFEPCDSALPEAGIEKIALYGKGSRPTHAARQIATGLWTSKLGPLEDIEHSLESLESEVYGVVVQVFRRDARTTTRG